MGCSVSFQFMHIILMNDNLNKVTKVDLIDIDVPKKIKQSEIRKNINITLQYISAWLSGNGAVALNNLMEDLATSEISVFQLKQWIHAGINIEQGPDGGIVHLEDTTILEKARDLISTIQQN